MTETQFVQFEGLAHPVALENAAEFVPLMSRVLSAWPRRNLDERSDCQPFATIRPAEDKRWEVSIEDAPDAPRTWDGINAVCDLVAEMAWERLRSDPELLCLHAAAVDFGGRLVVFPNARRAGKSTLAIALARLGLPLYTDDFLPVRIDGGERICEGIANGVLPRLRLPVPEGFSDTFKSAVVSNPGPSNRQYKYLEDLPVASCGETLPLGAMVVLDRRDEPTRPHLSAMAREDALESLITQNFARTRHAGAILNSIDLISRNLPIYRLSYHSAETAAEYLSTHADLTSGSAARMEAFERDDRQAVLCLHSRPAPEFVRNVRYQQAPDVTETTAGDDCFLADGSGLGIFRLNPLSAAIWSLLAEPVDLQEVTEILAAAFPDVATDQIAGDCERLMEDLAKAHLIVAERQVEVDR